MGSPPTARCYGGFALTPGPSGWRVDPPPSGDILSAMRAILALLIVLPTVAVSPARAQADYSARLGLTFATRLVTDNIVQDITTRQSLAPTLFLGASLPFSPAYSA